MTNEHLFIIGAQRCGTTYLYKVLDSHPEIYMAKPLRPEPKFFINDLEYSNGKLYYENKYFSSIDDSIKVLGEKGTSYIEHPDASDRIKSFYPNAKIIVLLRNPVERAISNYFFSYENGLETRSIEEVFLLDKKPPDIQVKTSVSPFAYIKRGEYLNYLLPYHNAFRNNLKIILFDDLFSSTNIYMNIFGFLNVDTSHKIEITNKKINQSTSVQKYKISEEVNNKLYNYFEQHIIELEKFLGEKTKWNDKV